WSVAAVAAGAGLGALARWGLGAHFNALFPSLPPGTLLANLIGGYVVGLALAFFSQSPAIPNEWRLLIVTGFCGGLTTFSTFSAEVLTLLQQGRLAWGVAAIAVHVIGSLGMTLAGVLTWQWFDGG
ncbi:MAG: fluoride efflux transporter CrcB, partial [Magnetococcales bacterium]|nr:fluoride efflux transporter CrcB [Magnetococcales bacterium]